MFLLGDYFTFANTNNVELFHGLARDESSSIHSAKQNKPDIKHGKGTMLKNKNVMSEIEFNTILNKPSTVAQWGRWGRSVDIRKA